jgi:hypothetical protein
MALSADDFAKMQACARTWVIPNSFDLIQVADIVEEAPCSCGWQASLMALKEEKLAAETKASRAEHGEAHHCGGCIIAHKM